MKTVPSLLKLKRRVCAPKRTSSQKRKSKQVEDRRIEDRREQNNDGHKHSRAFFTSSMKNTSMITFLLLSSTAALSLRSNNNKHRSRQLQMRQQKTAPTTSTATPRTTHSQNNTVSKATHSFAVCWIVLICSIFLECLDTTVSKFAQEKGSTPLFFMACALNLIRYDGMRIIFFNHRDNASSHFRFFSSITQHVRCEYRHDTNSGQCCLHGMDCTRNTCRHFAGCLPFQRTHGIVASIVSIFDYSWRHRSQSTN